MTVARLVRTDHSSPGAYIIERAAPAELCGLTPVLHRFGDEIHMSKVHYLLLENDLLIASMRLTLPRLMAGPILLKGAPPLQGLPASDT
jgi:hypothetical protein